MTHLGIADQCNPLAAIYNSTKDVEMFHYR
jgi:hypothetical protein